MRIAIACDHRGVVHKGPVARALESDGHQLLDFGTSGTTPVDYPDYARMVGVAVRDRLVDVGVLICGSGAGVAIAANKIRGVRAALCHDLFTARQAREDDDANVLCLGARVISVDMAITLARTFVAARFSHAERHERRLAKIAELESSAPPPLDPASIPGSAPRISGAVARTLELVGGDLTAAALDRLRELDAGRRIWTRDGSLWSDRPAVGASIVNRLGWLTAPAEMSAHLGELTAFADSVRRDGFADVILLGMGGSSLAAEVLMRTFGPPPKSPTLAVLDTTDPAAIKQTLARLKLPQSLFIVSSKSGTTAEMLALYKFFRAELERRVDRPGEHFVAITDGGTPLERLASDGGFRRVFLNDPAIGGRFSALSFFGLVPGALLGIDLSTLLERATLMARVCGASVSPGENPALRLGAILGGLANGGRDKVTLVLSEPIRSFGTWLEQLMTESTGKSGKGLVVVHEEPLAPPSAYGADRLFVALLLAGDTEFEPPLAALAAAGHPLAKIVLRDRFDLGGEFFRWELAIAAVGALLGVNPFDEPNVAQAKEATQTALATFKDAGRLPEWPTEPLEDIARVIREARPGDYVAVLAYLTPDPETTGALQHLRLVLRDRTRLATTVGYGPRYLHSTGQLHKGGPPTPILLLLTQDHSEDVAIPGEPYGFGTLEMAQALGDLATLRAAHRRAFLIPIHGRPPDAIARLGATLEKLLT